MLTGSQSVVKLRTDVEQGTLRYKEAESRNAVLEVTLTEREEKLNNLRQKLDLTRQLLAIAPKWGETQTRLKQLTEKIAKLDAKSEEYSTRLERAERETDAFEAKYLDIQGYRKDLEEQFEGLF
ncbi:hypothetical protein H0H81_007022 [Sphagnurus paluster]|uniref:Uncharacterized protein n=1 Tax=Sphagnurus paluster TaxID=117069 RepID=A0A9P7FZ87_9AGAR|nr:hypothetical protein H0H81_007022 [Sphagnurus paluster]